MHTHMHMYTCPRIRTYTHSHICTFARVPAYKHIQTYTKPMTLTASDPLVGMEELQVLLRTEQAGGSEAGSGSGTPRGWRREGEVSEADGVVPGTIVGGIGGSNGGAVIAGGFVGGNGASTK